MSMIVGVVLSMFTVILFLVLIMSFRWTRNLAGFGGVSPTGLAASVSNAIGS